MKTIADAAMDAIAAGEAIVTGAVEITPLAQTLYLDYNATFDYQIIDSVVDADPPADVVPPSAGFSSSGSAPFGHDSGTGLSPSHPISTAWLPQKSLWLTKDITVSANGTLTFRGHVENGALFFIDDELVGAVNADNSQSTSATGIPYIVTASVAAGTRTLKILVVDEATVEPNDNTYFYTRVTGVSDSVLGDPLRLWGGYGPIEIDGNDFQGLGNSAMAQQTQGALGGVAQGLTLTLSAVDPTALDLIDDAPDFKGASVVIYRLIFASDGKTLLDAHVFDRGRIDTIASEEVVGAAAAISAAVESAARGLGRSGARMRSDSDQRLINANDGYFKNTAFAGEKSLYWGGKRPARSGSVLSGGGGGTTTGGSLVLTNSA